MLSHSVTFRYRIGIYNAICPITHKHTYTGANALTNGHNTIDRVRDFLTAMPVPIYIHIHIYIYIGILYMGGVKQKAQKN